MRPDNFKNGKNGKQEKLLVERITNHLFFPQFEIRRDFELDARLAMTETLEHLLVYIRDTRTETKHYPLGLNKEIVDHIEDLYESVAGVGRIIDWTTDVYGDISAKLNRDEGFSLLMLCDFDNRLATQRVFKIRDFNWGEVSGSGYELTISYADNDVVVDHSRI